MRNHVLSALLLYTIFLGAAESVPPQEKNTPLALCDSFERFLEAFVRLFQKETLQEEVESIEKMTQHLLQTAFSILEGTAAPVSLEDRTRRLKFYDEALQEKLAMLLVQHAHAVAITRKAPIQKPAHPEENQKKILRLFAGIVNNFFNIVQDPENRDNVVPNLMGMAAGMVEIGSEVIKSGELTADADMQTINTYVQQLDLATKQAMLAIVTKKSEALWRIAREG